MSSEPTAALAAYQEALRALRELDRQAKETVSNRQVLDGQLKENESVLQELRLVRETSFIYKKVGSILLKQEPGEAVANVSKRLEYIKGELKRVDERLSELESKAKNKQSEAI